MSEAGAIVETDMPSNRQDLKADTFPLLSLALEPFILNLHSFVAKSKVAL